MGRLVVGSILPTDTHAVGMVVHQCGHAEIGGDVGRVDDDLVGSVVQNDLFTPVA